MVMQQINTPLQKMPSYNGNLRVMNEMRHNMSHLPSPYLLLLKPESQHDTLTYAYAQSDKLTISISTNGPLSETKAFCFKNKKHWTIFETALKQMHWTIFETALKQNHWTISETSLKQKHWTVFESTKKQNNWTIYETA